MAYRKSIFHNPTQITKNISGYKDNQTRLIAGMFEHKKLRKSIRVICVYVPNGSEIGSDKFAYKLGWLQSLVAFIEKEKKTFDKICRL